MQRERQELRGGEVVLRAKDRVWRFPGRVLVMGVVNVTPDSFSDGGQWMEPARAVDHAVRLVEEGADILDIGGESTRPGATPVTIAEEMRRVLPVIEGLADRVGASVSVDTMKPEVAREAVRAGAEWVNDISACGGEVGRGEEMAAVVAESGVGYVCMHMRGTPATMQREPEYGDVVGEVRAFFEERLRWLASRGVGEEQVAVDPGIGFGKRVGHNLELLRRVDEFGGLGRPVMIGISRKSFLGRITGLTEPRERVSAGVAGALWSVGCGVQMVRTHDVRATVEALRVWEAIRDGVEGEGVA